MVNFLHMKEFMTATAVAHPNIAFIKYWGVRDATIHLPVNGSISMNLAELFTKVKITFDMQLMKDELAIDGEAATISQLDRMRFFLDQGRKLADISENARVETSSNFPMGAGVASSASVFAAAAVAVNSALDLNLDQPALSRLARLGSGSACRSIPSGFVEWKPGTDDQSSYAESIFPPEYWDLVDCIAIIQTGVKKVSSKDGHTLASSSPLQGSRLLDTPRRLDVCRKAIRERDFSALAEIVELDSNWMHAVMMTSTPPLLYWDPMTLVVMKAVTESRQKGLPVCYTVDAGPNVHVITVSSASTKVQDVLQSIPGVQDVLICHPGGAANRADSSSS
jgi:diphosphomevalonate decarboxylase